MEVGSGIFGNLVSVLLAYDPVSEKVQYNTGDRQHRDDLPLSTATALAMLMAGADPVHHRLTLHVLGGVGECHWTYSSVWKVMIYKEWYDAWKGE